MTIRGAFFTYFVAALQEVNANLGREIEGARRSGQLPPSFIATLSGSHRFILSCLTEVLNQQPEEIQRFLLKASILDRLNGDLCSAVTGRLDDRVLQERLFNSNLFLTPWTTRDSDIAII